MKKLLLLFLLLLASPGYAAAPEPLPAEPNEHYNQPKYAMVWAAAPKSSLPVKPILVGSLPMFDVVTTSKPSTTGGGGGGGGGLAVGGAVTGGSPNQILYVDAAGNLSATRAGTGLPTIDIGNVGYHCQASSFGGATAWTCYSNGTAATTMSNQGLFLGTGQVGWTGGASLAPPDIGFTRAAAGVVRVTNGGAGDGTLQFGSVSYAGQLKGSAAVGGVGINRADFPATIDVWLGNDGAGSKINLPSGGFLNWTNTTSALSGVGDTGLARAAAGVVKITNGAGGDGTIRIGDGTCATPGYSYTGHPTYGITWNAGAVNGTNQPFVVCWNGAEFAYIGRFGFSVPPNTGPTTYHGAPQFNGAISGTFLNGLYVANLATGGGIAGITTASVNRVVYVGNPKTITSGVATTIWRGQNVAIPISSSGEMHFTVTVANATDRQTVPCSTYWSMINMITGAGGETCTHVLQPAVCSAATTGAATLGTLTVTVGVVVGTDACDYQVTATSSLATITSAFVSYEVEHNQGDRYETSILPQ